MAAPVVIRIRHGQAPTPSGCRWCGFEQHQHVQRWAPVRKWHRWERPTQAQTLARMKARRQSAA